MTRLEEWPSSTEFGLQARLLMWPRFSMRRPGPPLFTPDFKEPKPFGYNANANVGSLRLDGIRFVVYSNDHLPRHIHGFLGETEVIVDLRVDGNVSLAERRDAVRPADAKRSAVRRILNVAASHFDELAELWRSIHDNA